jgi:hypothetical protein
MFDSHNVSVTVKTVFDYTPAAIDKIFSTYRRKCQHSSFVECRFNPIKQQFVLEGDARLMEYALCDFMDITQRMTLEDARKPKPELVLRSKPTQLNVIPARWTEDVPAEQTPTGRPWGAKEVCTTLSFATRLMGLMYYA